MPTEREQLLRNLQHNLLLLVAPVLFACQQPTVESTCKPDRCTPVIIVSDTRYIPNDPFCWKTFPPNESAVIPAGSTIQVYAESGGSPNFLRFVMKEQGKKLVEGWVNKQLIPEKLGRKRMIDPYCHPIP